MVSVYFDSNIFRNLKKQPELPEQKRNLYSRLHKYVFNNKRNFIFFYSHAHLLDLKNDKTDKKIDDLEYMGKIVDGNYLVHEFKAKIARYILVDPKTSFDELDDDTTVNDMDWSDFFNPEKYRESASEQEFVALEERSNYLKNIKISDLIPLDNIPEDMKETFGKIFPIDNPDATFIDLLQKFTCFSKEFQHDKSIYLGLRNIANSGLVKYTIDPANFDLTISYEGTEKQQHFLEFIKERLDKTDYTQFDLHYQGYFHLDLLGLQMDSAKKMKPNSMLNDGHHSYYGAYCDILVSDDLQLREKSKVLYKLLGIETKVLSVEEFITEVFWIDLQIDTGENVFWDKVISEINRSFVKKIDQPTPDKQIIYYHSKQYYLGYFNEVCLLHKHGKDYLVFLHSVNNYSSRLAGFKVIQEVTNKCIGLFGLDDYAFSLFNYEKEVEQIDNGQWNGRIWTRKNIQIILEINSASKKLTLYIHNPNV